MVHHLVALVGHLGFGAAEFELAAAGVVTGRHVHETVLMNRRRDDGRAAGEVGLPEQVAGVRLHAEETLGDELNVLALAVVGDDER